MKIKPLSPREWLMLHRLHAAGCPVDITNLEPPVAPFRVVELARQMASNVITADRGSGVAFRIRVVASSATTITGFRLTANWLRPPLEWAHECQDHRGDYCFVIPEGVHVHFSSVLNRSMTGGIQLRAGQHVEGYMLARTPVAIESGKEELLATLWIRDLLDNEYPYVVHLRNRPAAFANLIHDVKFVAVTEEAVPTASADSDSAVRELPNKAQYFPDLASGINRRLLHKPS